VQAVKPRKPGKSPISTDAPFPGMVSLPLKKSTLGQFLRTLDAFLEADLTSSFDLFIWLSDEYRARMSTFRFAGAVIESGWTTLKRGSDGTVNSKTLPISGPAGQESGFFLGFFGTGWSITVLVSDVNSSRDLQEPIFFTWLSSDPETAVAALKKFKFEHTIQTDLLKASASGERFQLILAMLEQMNASIESRDYRIQWSDRLNAFANAIAWELDLGKLLPLATDRFKEAIGFDFFELQLFDRDKQKFIERFTWRRNDTKYGGKLMSLELQTSILRAIYRHRHVVLIPDLTKEDAVLNPKLLYITELKTAVILPLVYERRVHGVLKLFFRDPERVAERDLEWLEEMSALFTRSLANARLFSSMNQLASVDGLTGVNNRRSFSDQLSREYKRFRRFGGELALLMVDVDHFKQYNDREGHLQGDQVLRGIADLLKRSVRETDFVCRYGGEEFSIILPGATATGAMQLADKLRFTVETFGFLNGHKQPLGHVSISVGVACSTPQVTSPEELIHLADMALYQAKQNGRNLVYLCLGPGKFSTTIAEEGTSPTVDSAIAS